ncbi:cytochrome b/b6 domain-containing protein [Methylomarinum sp. Ch1-1]|uniref:Cytochrome b/b6 domain-containing protein n=1 Tax=Methylomarinum roseum TaxID=3067653 RepID=A0AAU7NZH0_9GAMM|nr:cytochrome b/b6 domain-containing protein [Methylomarinum sp. Ch1-1]MDP4521521.1 cytochrome b/b6 domain-containing protein [Methylomarinum sp. Ch1-1]
MSNRVKVWDLPLRIFHWTLVAAFLIAYVSEDDLLTVHVWAGYLIGGLLLFRIVWGFVGNRYARFANFICSPAAGLRYLQEVVELKGKRYLGHNPAGAWMIVLLLLSLLLTTLTGVAVYAADQSAGPMAGLVGTAQEELWEESHEFFANLTVFLVILHVLGVLLESFVHRESLVRSMWHGFKRAEEEGD